jgi:hypothetical protein
VVPGSTGGSATGLLRLQRSAGNKAVRRLLDLQRDPTDPAPLPDQPLAPRLAEAKTVVTKGDLDDPAFDHFRESTAGTVTDVINQLWLNELYMVDVDPAGTGLPKADARLLASFKDTLKTRVTKALNDKLAALAKGLPKDTTIADQVETIFNESPRWGEGDVADRLYAMRIGPGPIGSGSPSGAKELWSALANVSKAIVASKRKDKMGKSAIAHLDATAVGAVKTLLDPTATWVVTGKDTDDLTDRAAASLSRPAARADPAWKELREKMPTFILAAETQLINEVVPQSKKIPLVPESWALFRNRYVATISKPMWTFHRDNIVDAEIFGEQVKASSDSSGLHKDVAAVIPLLEESAMRLGNFANKKELYDAKQQPGSEFRFEAMSHPDWMARSKHMSFHGTGRAMDFRADKNRDFGGATHQLVSILGGGELSELSAGSHEQRRDLQKVAAHNANVVSKQKELQDRLAASTDDAEKADLQSKIDRLSAHLTDETSSDALVTKVRDRASETHSTVKDIEANFQATWKEIQDTLADPKNTKDLVTLVKEKVDVVVTQTQTAYDTAKAAQVTLTAARKEKKPDDPALVAQVGTIGTLEARLARMRQVTKLLDDPKAKTDDAQTQAAMLAKTGKLADSGLTDMPSWLVEAFAERGWQWGMWPGFADAMHFDYLGPVSDVRPEAQLL